MSYDLEDLQEEFDQATLELLDGLTLFDKLFRLAAESDGNLPDFRKAVRYAMEEDQRHWIPPQAPLRGYGWDAVPADVLDYVNVDLAVDRIIDQLPDDHVLYLAYEKEQRGVEHVSGDEPLDRYLRSDDLPVE